MNYISLVREGLLWCNRMLVESLLGACNVSEMCDEGVAETYPERKVSLILEQVSESSKLWIWKLTNPRPLL